MGPEAAAAIKTVGTVLSFATQLKAANAASAEGSAVRRAMELEAQQLETQAGQARASGQRAAAEERRRERLIQSSLTARAAASGGGAADPTVVKIGQDIAAEGTFRALSALFEGKERSRGMLNAALLRRFGGAEAARAGKIRRQALRGKAFSTLLEKSVGDTLFSKFGEELPTDASLDSIFRTTEFG